jgi:hypothetical protein
MTFYMVLYLAQQTPPKYQNIIRVFKISQPFYVTNFSTKIMSNDSNLQKLLHNYIKEIALRNQVGWGFKIGLAVSQMQTTKA